MQDTKARKLNSPHHFNCFQKAIVYASDAPLSIVIVGVGQDAFKSMEVLDGDKVGAFPISTLYLVMLSPD
jgi:hypothetical protein